MKIFDIKINKKLLLLIAINVGTIVMLEASNSAGSTQSLDTALSVVKAMANTALPPSASASQSIPSPLPNYIPPYSPPAAPLNAAASVAKTLTNTVLPPTTPILPAPSVGTKTPTVNSNNKQTVKPNAGPFNNNGVVTKKIALNQVHADPNFKQKVEDAWQRISGNNANSFVNVNAHNGSVYVKGDEQHVIDLENYIESLDKPVVQVRVDAIILFAQRNYNFDIGIDWSGIYNRAQSIISNANPFGFVGLGGDLTDIPKPTSPIDAYYVNSSGVPSTGSSPNTNLYVNPTNFAINLFNKTFATTTVDNAGSSYLQLPFTFGGPDLNLRRLNLVLSVAESESKVKIVSRPSVLTSSNQTAVVTIGQQLPMQQSALNTSTGAIYKGSQIVYKSVGISLTVLPVVGADNKTINLTIKIADLEIISGSTQSNSDGIMTNPPVLSDLAVTNQLVLKSGQTTVIGGLAKRSDKVTKNQVPWINRIPVFGNLFKASLSADVELEQFIFITPTIVEENL